MSVSVTMKPQKIAEQTWDGVLWKITLQNLRGVCGKVSRIRPVGVSCLFPYDMDVLGAGVEQLGSLFHLCSTPISMPWK